MNFSEKLTVMRRGRGMSQEQLADRLGVTRQSVSKWESGAATPELTKLVALSELFHVSVDYLVKDYAEEPEFLPAAAEGADPSVARLAEQMEEMNRRIQGISGIFRGWAWDSKTRVFGIPLVSVRFQGYSRMTKNRNVAKGIIAVGNMAIGVVALGALSVGVVGIGALSVGAFALGAVAFGLAALGPVAIGLLAFGPVAIGLWYAGGVAALGGRIAVGVAAVGDTAVGYDAAGGHVLLWGSGLTRGQVESFLLEHNPNLWPPLLRLLGIMGASIK